MVEMHLLNQRVMQCRHALKLAVKDRDVKKRQLIQDMLSGAVIEDGPHEAHLVHSTKLVVA